MQLQQWEITRITDGKKETIGRVITTLDAAKNCALAKACYKFSGGRGVSIGWSIEAEKDGVLDMGR